MSRDLITAGLEEGFSYSTHHNNTNTLPSFIIVVINFCLEKVVQYTSCFTTTATKTIYERYFTPCLVRACGQKKSSRRTNRILGGVWVELDDTFNCYLYQFVTCGFFRGNNKWVYGGIVNYYTIIVFLCPSPHGYGPGLVIKCYKVTASNVNRKMQATYWLYQSSHMQK